MQLLKKRILQDGKCFEGGILKVDSFINHQMDPQLMKAIGVEFVRRFAGTNVNKIMTIEASGIAPAIMTGYLLNLQNMDIVTGKQIGRASCRERV